MRTYPARELIGLVPTEPEAAALQNFKTTFAIPDGQRVICPGMGTNICVSTVFGRESVVNVVEDPGDQQYLTEKGYQAVYSAFEAYRPEEPADILISIDGDGLPVPDAAIQAVRAGGLAVVNNLTGWAESLADMRGFTLAAALMPDIRAKEPYWITDATISSRVSVRPTAYGLHHFQAERDFESQLIMGAREGSALHAEELKKATQLDYLSADVAAHVVHGSFFDALFVFKRDQPVTPRS